MPVSLSMIRNLKVRNPKMAFPYKTNEGWKITKTYVALAISSKKKEKGKKKKMTMMEKEKKRKRKADKYRWKVNEAHYARWRLRWRLWALTTKTNEGF
jgi:hypothetical protein